MDKTTKPNQKSQSIAMLVATQTEVKEKKIKIYKNNYIHKPILGTVRHSRNGRHSLLLHIDLRRRQEPHKPSHHVVQEGLDLMLIAALHEIHEGRRGMGLDSIPYQKNTHEKVTNHSF
jgi:hypothetical protein